MNYIQSNDERLSKNIKELGFILGDVLIEQEGKKLFNKVETLRNLSKSLRQEQNPENVVKIKNIVRRLDLAESHKIIKAFSIYFILVNAADEVNNVIEEKINFDKEGREKDYFGSAFEEIKKMNISNKAVQKIFNNLEITPVFTAHPTEATRQTILKKILKISQLLLEKELYCINKIDKENTQQKIKTEITLLWQSNEIRFSKISVQDEVMRGLFFFKEIIYNVLSDFYSSINYSYKKAFGKEAVIPEIINFGSWIGGDRDGHPFVTEEITKDTFNIYRNEIIKLYLNDLNKIYEELSTSILLKGGTKNLIESIEYDRKNLNVNETDNKLREPSEIYRSKLFLIYKKLEGVLDNSNYHYDSCEHFLADLELINESLLQNNGELLVKNLITPFMQKVKTFGFHFVKLDIRQNASLIKSAISEIFNTSLPEINFDNFSETEKIKILTKEILCSRPLINKFLNLSKTSESVLNEFGLILWGQKNIAKGAAGDYIISNSSKVSDVLSSLLLAKECGLIKVEKGAVIESRIDILPLFETITDLQNAEKVMNILFENEAYQQHLSFRKNEQKIMLGYSDSNKDGGIVTSNFELYKAQIKLENVTSRKKIRLTLFHGRGGSISRGGGPVNKSILAQPSGTISGKIKITEQGEMITSKYLIPEAAKKSMEIMTSAVIEKTARSLNLSEKSIRMNYIENFEIISEKALSTYKELVEDNNFFDYFRSATPIDLIEILEIGSRPPARKKKNDIASLRAIPWVFSWTQNRQTISGWYGFGSAIEYAIENNRFSMKELNELYESWSFFKALVQNIEMVLAKTDMIIGAEYSNLTKSKSGLHIFNKIRSEYIKTVKFILAITGEKQILDHNKQLQRTIQLRNPYIDPISFIQTYLIEKYRDEKKSKNRDELLNVLRSSVNGIAAGIKNTG